MKATIATTKPAAVIQFCGKIRPPITRRGMVFGIIWNQDHTWAIMPMKNSKCRASDHRALQKTEPGVVGNLAAREADKACEQNESVASHCDAGSFPQRISEIGRMRPPQ